MSCNCENKKKASELDRIEGLAKKAARLEQSIYYISKREDGTYDFHKLTKETPREKIYEIIHYI